MNDRQRLTEAFKELQNLGYFAPVEFGTQQCCQSCSWYEVPDGTEKAVFWHQQGDERAFGVRVPYLDDDGYENDAISYEECAIECNTLVNDLNIYWAGDAQEIVAALESQGLTVQAPESEADSVKVLA